MSLFSVARSYSHARFLGHISSKWRPNVENIAVNYFTGLRIRIQIRSEPDFFRWKEKMIDMKKIYMFELILGECK